MRGSWRPGAEGPHRLKIALKEPGARHGFKPECQVGVDILKRPMRHYVD